MMAWMPLPVPFFRMWSTIGTMYVVRRRRPLRGPALLWVMRKDKFKVAEEWAYRREQQLGLPAARVQLVAMPNRKGPVKVKVRHVDGELESMEEFVTSTHLRCRWKDWKLVERDEKKEIAFLQHMADEPSIDHVVAQAASEVLISTGEDLMIFEGRSNYTKLWDIQIPGLERVAQRCILTEHAWTKWPSLKDRNGHYLVHTQVLIDVAIAFAQAEPETVHLHLDHEANQLLEDQNQWGSDRRSKMIRAMPAHTLARHWAGGMREHKYLRERVRELELLVEYTITALESSGEIRKANYARRRLEAGYNRSLALQLDLE